MENFEAGTLETHNETKMKIGEILVEQKIIPANDVQDVLEKQKNEYPDFKFGEVAIIEAKSKPQKGICSN